MSNEVVNVNQSTAVSVPAGVSDDTYLSSDMQIPQILLQQPLSEFVTDGKAKPGDIVNSMSEKKLGDAEVSVGIIPLKVRNTWVNLDLTSGAAKYVSTEPRTSANDSLPWDFSESGKIMKRVKQLELFCLLVSDVASNEKGGEVDLDSVVLPVVVKFRSTGYKAGRAVISHLTKCQIAGVPPYYESLNLSCYLEKNSKGAFWVWKVGRGEKTSDYAKEQAQRWLTTMNSASQNITVHAESAGSEEY